MNAAELLQDWVARRISGEAAVWWQAAVDSARTGADRALYTGVSLAARRLGKLALRPQAAELEAAHTLRPGWDPRGWTLDQAARIGLLLAAERGADDFTRRLDALCATADVDELVAFYRGLPLYPDAPRHRMRAAEGVRSNMKVVFEAVVHHNPYPSEQFDDPAWNQMVLKALFVGSPLAPIAGLDERANPSLARMLCDYAHERWAASRPISPELWRCVGPFARGPMLADLERAASTGTPVERNAALSALQRATDPAAAELLARLV
jgi:hypothetical protein